MARQFRDRPRPSSESRPRAARPPRPAKTRRSDVSSAGVWAALAVFALIGVGAFAVSRVAGALAPAEDENKGGPKLPSMTPKPKLKGPDYWDADLEERSRKLARRFMDGEGFTAMYQDKPQELKRVANEQLERARCIFRSYARMQEMCREQQLNDDCLKSASGHLFGLRFYPGAGIDRFTDDEIQVCINVGVAMQMMKEKDAREAKEADLILDDFLGKD